MYLFIFENSLVQIIWFLWGVCWLSWYTFIYINVYTFSLTINRWYLYRLIGICSTIFVLVRFAFRDHFWYPGTIHEAKFSTTYWWSCGLGKRVEILYWTACHPRRVTFESRKDVLVDILMARRGTYQWPSFIYHSLFLLSPELPVLQSLQVPIRRHSKYVGWFYAASAVAVSLDTAQGSIPKNQINPVIRLLRIL